MVEPAVTAPTPVPMDGDHVYRVRIYYEDTDAGGIVYYANYLKFAERARTELLRHLGVEQARLMSGDGIAFAVRHLSADYLRPARLDDLLEVHTRIVKVGGASLQLKQAVRRDGADLVRFEVRLACLALSGRGRPVPLPRDLRASLEDFHHSQPAGPTHG